MLDGIVGLVHEQLQPVNPVEFPIMPVPVQFRINELADKDKCGKSYYQIGYVDEGEYFILQ